MSFILGLFLFIDGVLAFLFFILFRWIEMNTVAYAGAAIIAIPIWIKLIKTIIKEEKESKFEEEREKRNKQIKREQQKELERKNTICLFQDGISQSEFELIAHRVAKRIKRLRVEVKGPVIECDVDSQSGISTWQFIIDFNDFGHITGNWWMTRRDNYDSNIPNRYADLMQEAIETRLE